MFWDLEARGLAAPCDRAASCSRWVSFLAGGELLFAWLRRSSAALSLASRASSSLVWVVTACFLRACQPAPISGEEGGPYFSRTVLSRVARPSSKLNRLSSSDMKLRARVLRAVSLRQAGAMLAPGELTIEGGCLASSLGLGRPWWPSVQGTRKSW